MKYKQHEISKEAGSVRVRGFFGKNGFKSINAAKRYISASIDQWIEENDTDEFLYAFVSGTLYRYSNDGQFRAPNKLHLAGSCSVCYEADFYVQSTAYDYRG